MSAMEAASPDDEPQKLNPSGHAPALQGSNIPLGWKPSRAAPIPVVRCVQIKKDGTRCKRWSLRGYDKCLGHAGPGARMKDGNVSKYAEAVIEAGRLRLVEDTDKAIDVLNDLIGNQSSEQIRLKAATEILDRAGVRGGFDINVEVTDTSNPAEEIAKRLTKLKEGAEAVNRMKQERMKEIEESAAAAHPEEQVIDGVVVEDTDDQDTLF